STLLKLLAGLLSPDYGTVRVAGLDPRRPKARRSFGFCPDVDRYYENLSGVEFVTWMLRLSGFRRREARQRAEATLDRLGLGDAMRRSVGGYSKGMRQRVKLAQALAHEPRVVLLDEPMTGLDPLARHETGELLRSLAERGVAVVVSSHVLHELEAPARHVLRIHPGRLVAGGPVAELRRQAGDRPYRLAIGTPAPREVAARLSALPVVRGLRIAADAVEVETDAGEGLFDELTAIGTEGLVRELRPLDE